MQLFDKRRWYSVSVTAVRRWITLGVLAALTGIGFLVFKQWQRYDLQQRAIQTIEQAGQLADQLAEREGFALLRAENQVAWDRLDDARAALVDGRWDAAYSNGRQSLMVLKSILEIGSRDGTIRFLSVQGGVEYRRGERGAWKRAREQDSLDPGDWVKTDAEGTAEIVFADNTLYTLRQSTMVHLGGGRRDDQAARDEEPGSTDIVFGWVELNTAQRGSRVSTPQSEARVRRDSEALVTYDRDRKRGRFAAFAGGLEVRTGAGEVRELGSLELVEQVDTRLGQTTQLPDRPRLAAPGDNDEIDLDAVDRVTLAWRAVERGNRYRLQVSDNRLFATTLVEDRSRRKTSALLGLRREGSFYWKVAALGRGGEQGPWSEPRAFRVAALAGVGLIADQTPPELEVQEVQPYGSLVIVKGRTEPGAAVTVNGEQASVALDGTFNKTIQMTQEGWAAIEIVATDAAGNPNRQRQRVHIDVF